MENEFKITKEEVNGNYYNMNLKMTVNYNLKFIQGIILDSNGNPFNSAIVEFIECNSITGISRNLGTITTDTDGRYVALIEIKLNNIYTINVYEALV